MRRLKSNINNSYGKRNKNNKQKIVGKWWRNKLKKQLTKMTGKQIKNRFEVMVIIIVHNINYKLVQLCQKKIMEILGVLMV